MLVLIILVVSIVIFRGLGFAGVSALASWPADVREALALMLFFTASAHFTPMKEDLIRMTPQWVPWPRAMVFFTGLCEIAGKNHRSRPRNPLRRHANEVFLHGREMRARGEKEHEGEAIAHRSEERRVGKECRSRWSP